jgi:hypothetical protein
MRSNLQSCVCGNGDEVYRDASLANLPDTRHIIVFFSEKRELNSHRHLVNLHALSMIYLQLWV